MSKGWGADEDPGVPRELAAMQYRNGASQLTGPMAQQDVGFVRRQTRRRWLLGVMRLGLKNLPHAIIVGT